ncbi:VOC family protein [Rhodovulum euryhalinum]|uniref:Glyoxalase-like protein n=1 Tax=Rhodovulum euryhalinum TaxID=35805 RepID=A0A4V2SAA4_9RHOB|nr:VOC family protein [Rhodovulum euryhalinum]TCO70090.1 glyoxalase-like protein [Rhodovulum euryhalinum]
MEHPVKGVDHVFLLVEDLDRAADAYRRLGFTLSPRGLHSAAKGTANYTIMFPRDYMELLGVVAPTEGNAARRAALARDGEGLQAVACRIADADAARAALDALGIGTETVGHFERPVPLPRGGTAPAAFATLAFATTEVPFGTVFMCQHKTRETVWLPELLTHPNGACGLAEILARTADPDANGTKLARLFAAGRVTGIAGGCRVETGSHSAPITCLTEAALAARFPGLDLAALPAEGFAGVSLHTADPGQTRAWLEANGLSVVETADGIALPPSVCAGAVLEFVSG